MTRNQTDHEVLSFPSAAKARRPRPPDKGAAAMPERLRLQSSATSKGQRSATSKGMPEDHPDDPGPSAA